MLRAIVIVALLLITGCGRTVAFKDGVISNQQQHDTDYNACVQEAMPLFPTRWTQQPYWVQVPIYGRRIHDGREVRYVSHYQSHLRFETLDANEGERVAYVTRCMSGKGYTYRYLSKDELAAQGLD